MVTGFPIEFSQDVKIVLNAIPSKTISNISSIRTDESCQLKLLNGDEISFPYRIYLVDEYEQLMINFTYTQKMIYHALFTRSNDGFIREKHLKAILLEDFPSWIIPYIFKLSNEYIMQILEISFELIPADRIGEFKEFCELNIQYFLKSHDRMISYWNEFHRNKCYLYKNYIGKKLYEDYFGYTKSMEKMRRL